MPAATARGRIGAAVGAALVTLAIAATALGQYPSDPPHQFFGSAGGPSPPTVNGFLVPDGSVVTAWNEVGAAVGTGIVRDATWLISVFPPEAQTVAFSIDGSTLSDPHSVVAGGLKEVPLSLRQGGGASGTLRTYYAPNRTITLTRGWNLVAYTGTDVDAQALADYLDALDVVAIWDPVKQRFRTYGRTVPPGANTLHRIESGHTAWVRVTRETFWPMAARPQSSLVSLLPGWNLVAWWLEEDATPENAFAELGGRFEAAFALEAGTDAFKSYWRRSPLPALNSLVVVSPNQPIWVFISAGPPVLWAQVPGDLPDLTPIVVPVVQ